MKFEINTTLNMDVNLYVKELFDVTKNIAILPFYIRHFNSVKYGQETNCFCFKLR